MNTRRNFIKTTGGVALAFGAGTRIASAAISGNNDCHPPAGAAGTTCPLTGPSGNQSYTCTGSYKTGNGLPCETTCTMDEYGVFVMSGC